jgi:hypothetical protein
MVGPPDDHLLSCTAKCFQVVKLKQTFTYEGQQKFSSLHEMLFKALCSPELLTKYCKTSPAGVSVKDLISPLLSDQAVALNALTGVGFSTTIGRPENDGYTTFLPTGCGLEVVVAAVAAQSRLGGGLLRMVVKQGLGQAATAGLDEPQADLLLHHLTSTSGNDSAREWCVTNTVCHPLHKELSSKSQGESVAFKRWPYLKGGA